MTRKGTDFLMPILCCLWVWGILFLHPIGLGLFFGLVGLYVWNITMQKRVARNIILKHRSKIDAELCPGSQEFLLRFSLCFVFPGSVYHARNFLVIFYLGLATILVGAYQWLAEGNFNLALFSGGALLWIVGSYQEGTLNPYSDTLDFLGRFGVRKVEEFLEGNPEIIQLDKANE